MNQPFHTTPIVQTLLNTAGVAISGPPKWTNIAAATTTAELVIEAYYIWIVD